MASVRSQRSKRKSPWFNLLRLEDRLTPAITFMGPHTPQEMQILEQTGGSKWQPLLAAPTPTASQKVDFVGSGAWYFNLDLERFAKKLNDAPFEQQPGQIPGTFVISLVRPDATYQRFLVWEYSMMEAGLSDQFPDFHTYHGRGIDDPMATLAMDVTDLGFHAQVLSPTEGAYYIDPYFRIETSVYVSYYKYQNQTPHSYYCENNTTFDPAYVPDDADVKDGADDDCGCGDHDHENIDPSTIRTNRTTATTNAPASLTSNGGTLRTYRAAVAANVEYTTFHGGTVPLGQAAVVTAVNRVNQVYETELSVRLVLVANNSSLVYTTTDPYTNGNGSTMLGENQTNIDTVIGSANYDIGHVFSTGGGGVAGLGVVGTAGSKARGVTGSGSPVNDSFWIDYVAHEMGHQYGGNHTFNSSTSNCGGGNRNASTAYEQGSGNTIMAYAGICGADNLQSNSDPYFHWKSLDEISTFITNSTNGKGNTQTATGNNLPVVNAGASYVIPNNTPFFMTGSATDADGDPLTYLWEEADLGASTTVSTADNGSSPIFRSFNPTTSPTRYFPRYSDLLNNTLATGEVMPTFSTGRTINLALTVFDNKVDGAFARATTKVTTVNTGVAFAVTAPNTAVSWTGGSTQAVTWNVAGTTANGINAANVDILLSTDGGSTFPTTLAAGVANNGSANVVIPNTPTSTARIKVQPVGNVFFDISNANFTIVNGSTLSVTAVNPAAGSTVTAPLTQIDVTFSAAIKAATVDTSDLSLSVGTVTNAILFSPQVARYTVSGLTAEGTVNVTVNNNAVTDLSSNANNSFATSYTLDYGTTTFPVPLTLLGTGGAMVYTGTGSGTIGTGTDADAFTINLDGGGAVSLLLTAAATLRGSVNITGPGGVNQTVSAPSNGAPIVVQSVSTPVAGSFTITVSSVASTSGTYSLRLDLNGAMEAEGNGGTANDTTGTAQPLSAALNFGTASLATVRGRSDAGAGSLVSETEANDSTVTANDATGDFTAASTALYQMQINGSMSTTGDSDYFNIGTLQAGDTITVTMSGTDGGRGTMSDPRIRMYAGSATTTAVFDVDDRVTGFLDALQYRFTVGSDDTYYLRASTFGGTTIGTYQMAVYVENTGAAPLTTGVSNFTETEAGNTIGSANNASAAWELTNYNSNVTGTIGSGTDADYYKYTLAAGDLVTAIATSGGSADTSLAFYNAAGTLLYDEKGVSTSLVLNSAMYGYNITAAGTYYVKVSSITSTTGTYTLDVNLATAATPPAPSAGVDYYSFAVTAGQPLSLGVKGLSAGSLTVDLLDTGGGTMASGGAGATNFDKTLSFTPASSGTWFAKISGAANVDYQLALTQNATQDTEANDTFATAQALVNNKAIGSFLGDDDWYQFAVNAGQAITLTTTTPGDAAGEFVNTFDPVVELWDPSNTLVGSDDNSAGGKNATLTKTAAATGNYRARIRNSGASSGEYTLSLTLGAAAPSVTIDQAVGQADPTNGSPVNFTVVFSSAVSDFDSTDVTLGGTAGATAALVTGSGTTYNVAVSGMTTSGTVIATIGAGVASGNTASTSTDNTVTFDIAPPTGSSTPANVTTFGGASYTFTVTFSDNLGVSVATLDNSDVRVTGPGGFDVPATFVGVDVNTDGTPRVATYSITPPGGSWNSADNGNYSVNLQNGQVTDTLGNAATAATLGTFNVNVPSPGTVTNFKIDDGTAQRSMIRSLTVTFNATPTLPVNPADAFSLVRQHDSAAVTLNAVQAGNVVTLTFTGGAVNNASLADGRYTFKVLAGQVNGGNFDGDANGTPGDDYVLASASAPGTPTNVYRLFGDLDGDADTDLSDFTLFKNALGSSGFNPPYNGGVDFDGDGDVDLGDFVQFKARIGVAVP